MKGLIDSTLREGGQRVGICFSLVEKKSIVRQLAAIGIEEIEIGVSTPYGMDLPELMDSCRSMAPAVRIGLWSLCRRKNIEHALRLQPDVLSLSVPGSAILIEKKLERTREWVLKTAAESIARAREGGIGYVSLGIEDATRTAPGFLEKLITTARRAGAARIRLADTVGIATPGKAAALVRAVRSYFAGDVGVHMHNDFGMATANSIAALEAGADYADVTALGIGERAGNARLEEVAAFAALREGGHYRTTALKQLALFVADLSNRTVAPHEPVIGENIFHCESGLHLQGLTKDSVTYEPYGPEKVGTERKLLYGTKVGRKEIAQCLGNIGIRPQFEQLETMTRKVRLAAARLNQPLPQREFAALLQSL